MRNYFRKLQHDLGINKAAMQLLELLVYILYVRSSSQYNAARSAMALLTTAALTMAVQWVGVTGRCTNQYCNSLGTA